MFRDHSYLQFVRILSYYLTTRKRKTLCPTTETQLKGLRLYLHYAISSKDYLRLNKEIVQIYVMHDLLFLVIGQHLVTKHKLSRYSHILVDRFDILSRDSISIPVLTPVMSMTFVKVCIREGITV